jgi:hypothetical protein
MSNSLIFHQTVVLAIPFLFVTTATLVIRFGWRRGKAGHEL